MKKFVSVVIAAVTLVLCFMLAACDNKYTSNYSSSRMKTQSAPDSAAVSFDSFKGTYAVKLKNNGGEVSLTYKATLTEGSIKVYYDFNDEKLSLFEIGANGSKEGKTEVFTGNQTIYVIIESDGKCNEGSFSFALEKE